MEEKINKVLAQIEKDLRDINSARAQVENVVAAFSQLQKKVGGFVSNVADYSLQVEKISQSVSDRRNIDKEKFKVSFDALKKSCDDFVSVLDIKLNKTASDFAAKTNELYQRIEEIENKKLESFSQSISSLNSSCGNTISKMDDKSSKILTEFSEKVSKISGVIDAQVQSLHGEVVKIDKTNSDLLSAIKFIDLLKTDVEKLMAELKESQSAQDKDLHDIKNQLTNFFAHLSDVDKKVDLVQQTILGQNKTLNQLLQSLNAANTTLSEITLLIQTTQSSILNQIKNDTNQVAQNMNATFNNGKSILEKKIGKLQIIVIIQIILSILGLVMMFVINAK